MDNLEGITPAHKRTWRRCVIQSGKHRTEKSTHLRKIRMTFKDLCDKIFMVDKKINVIY